MERQDQTYTIRDLAREFSVTTRTLRFYEEKGLLTPTRLGNNRYYDSADRARLKLILRGKKIGLTLEESSDILAMYQARGRNQQQLKLVIERITAKEQQLKQQQIELKTMMADLKAWKARCETELANTKGGKK